MEESPAINVGACSLDESKIFTKPMHLAVIKEDIQTITCLKKSGVKLNDMEHGLSPLHLAVMLRKTLAVKKLVSLRANVSKKTKDGHLPLHLAVINDSVSLFSILRDDRIDGDDVDTLDKNGFSPLHIAVMLGKVEAVRKLLDEGADPELPNKEGNASLHLALVQGHSEVVDILVEYVAKPNALNNSEFRPLHLAVMCNQIDAIRKIADIEGANVNYLNGNGDAPVHIATKLGNLAAIEELHHAGANMRLKNSKGYCPVHLAVIFNRLSAIEILLQCGANLDCGDRYRNTPVHLALEQNNKDAVSFLCHFGANVNIKNGNGDTPLQCAVMSGNASAMKILLKSGANINHVNAKGMTPLQVAVCLGDVDVIKNLFKYGATMHSVDPAANRPLHIAARFCSSVGIKTLIKLGARLNPVNRDGLTALDIIIQYVRKSALKSSTKTVNDLYEKWNIKRKSPLDLREIMTSVRLILKYEILKNFDNTKLKNPAYMSDIPPPLISCINESLAEVRLMMSSMLHENLSLYSFVLFGWNYSMPLTIDKASEVALDHVLNVSLTKGYPIYRKDIVSRFERSALLKKVQGMRIYARRDDGKAIFIDYIALPLVIKHLKNDAILNLLLAYSNLDTNANVLKSSNLGKRKFAKSQLGSSSGSKKSYRVRTKKARPQNCTKKARSLSTNSSKSVSSSMLTRSKNASSSKTENVLVASDVKTKKSSIKTDAANCISVCKKTTKTKRASLRIKTTKQNISSSKKVTRSKYNTLANKAGKNNCPALSTRSKKEKSCVLDSKTSRRKTRSSKS